MRFLDRRVVVTGMGLVTPFGIGRDAFWEGLRSGRSTAKRLENLDLRGHPTDFACCVDDDAFQIAEYVRNRKSIKLMSRSMRFAVASAEMAMKDAALVPGEFDPRRAGVALGVGGVGLYDPDHLETLGQIFADLDDAEETFGFVQAATRHMNPLEPLKLLPNVAAAHVAIEQGMRGENVTVCTACTSGTQAIGEALRLMRQGKADVMLAGGTDAMINVMGLIGFGMLGVLSKRRDEPERASRPFELHRDGFVIGEGSAILVLETLEHARQRGAEPLGELLGYACCSDAFRITDEREDGSGCADAMRQALEDAVIAPEDIQYINAHGTGTRMNDKTEVLAIKEVFGSHVRQLAVSSTKSQIGHLVAAAGAVELAASVMALVHQTLPATINHEIPDPECDLDVVPNHPRQSEVRVVLSNSFGFGGQNACLVVARGDDL